MRDTKIIEHWGEKDGTSLVGKLTSMLIRIRSLPQYLQGMESL
jgi:hypothetical protein